MHRVGLLEGVSKAALRMNGGLPHYLALKTISNLSLEGQPVSPEILDQCIDFVRRAAEQKIEEMSWAMCAVALKVLMKGVVAENPNIS